jgi:hypothetical protein
MRGTQHAAVSTSSCLTVSAVVTLVPVIGLVKIG